MKRLYIVAITLLMSISVLVAQSKKQKIVEDSGNTNISKVSLNKTGAIAKVGGTNSTQAVNVVSYDFTVAGAAYVDPAKSNPPMVDLSGTGAGPYAMAAGDANSDGNVTTLDLTIWLPDNNTAASGYLNSDMNMDGNVTTLDLTKWLPSNNTAMSTHVPN